MLWIIYKRIFTIFRICAPSLKYINSGRFLPSQRSGYKPCQPLKWVGLRKVSSQNGHEIGGVRLGWRRRWWRSWWWWRLFLNIIPLYIYSCISSCKIIFYPFWVLFCFYFCLADIMFYHHFINYSWIYPIGNLAYVKIWNSSRGNKPKILKTNFSSPKLNVDKHCIT